MVEWLNNHYLLAIANYTILLGNPVHCHTVELLRLFSLILAVVGSLRLLKHCVSYHRMRRLSQQFDELASPQLFECYRAAAAQTGIRRLPPLYQASGHHPLLFAVGWVKPSIFMAPCVARTLPPEELRAALVHELIHLKRRDTLFTWLLEILYVSIPLLVIQAFAMNFVYSATNSYYAICGSLVGLILVRIFLWDRILFLRELSCDDLAVNATGDPLALASSLIRVWKLSKQNAPHRWIPSIPAAVRFLPFSTPGLDLRVRRLIDYRQPVLRLLAARALRISTGAVLCTSLLFLWTYHAGNPLAKLPMQEKTFHDCNKSNPRR